MLIVCPFTQRVRSFSTADGLEQVEKVAQDFSLKAAVGGWLSDDLQANTQQMDNLIAVAQNRHVDLVIVGSEVLLLGDLAASQLMAYIDKFRVPI